MRLIDADVLLSKPWGVTYHPYEADGSISECDAVAEEIIKECRNIVHDAPTVEPKKGEWIDRTEYEDNIECPFCHETWNVIDNCTETFNFCPNCGADMRGEYKCD